MSYCSPFFNPVAYVADRLADKTNNLAKHLREPLDHLALPEKVSQFATERTAANMLVDWLETQDAHIFQADLPGLTKEAVEVAIQD
ncbi:hypothetical protein R1flu_001531 [Riccia fluitans]|uniref:Uncharacterized protein n=1 Tax=Riccia fluitans TaxID=41844 RepID=A0ABD1Y3J6_9MARC